MISFFVQLFHCATEAKQLGSNKNSDPLLTICFEDFQRQVNEYAIFLTLAVDKDIALENSIIELIKVLCDDKNFKESIIFFTNGEAEVKNSNIPFHEQIYKYARRNEKFVELIQKIIENVNETENGYLFTEHLNQYIYPFIIQLSKEESLFLLTERRLNTKDKSKLKNFFTTYLADKFEKSDMNVLNSKLCLEMDEIAQKEEYAHKLWNKAQNCTQIHELLYMIIKYKGHERSLIKTMIQYEEAEFCTLLKRNNYGQIEFTH